MRATRRLASDRHNLWQVLRPLVVDRDASPSRRIRALGHTLMGAALAEQLAPLEVDHIHCHHGYFASWMALVAARLLGIDFSFTLHGSDLLHRADLLAAKLRACKFCVTVSDFNRQYLLRQLPLDTSRKGSGAAPGSRSPCFPGPLTRVATRSGPSPVLSAGGRATASGQGLCLSDPGLQRSPQAGTRFPLLDRRRGAGTPGSRTPNHEAGTPGTGSPGRPRAPR